METLVKNVALNKNASFFASCNLIDLAERLGNKWGQFLIVSLKSLL
ncbi:MAG: hypothetical protein ACLTHV_06225 [Parasutterella excrementihominis]